ncbi:MAG: hypothetical protein KJ594_04360, partial [Candidatus Omnitrophica bacterium]|nr:hypothetical protein [Candidatus Omnitrophota bacterium]
MSKCIFCNSNVEMEGIRTNKSQRCNCPTCGEYILSMEAFQDGLPGTITQEDKILFSGYLRNRPIEDKNE